MSARSASRRTSVSPVLLNENELLKRMPENAGQSARNFAGSSATTAKPPAGSRKFCPELVASAWFTFASKSFQPARSIEALPSLWSSTHSRPESVPGRSYITSCIETAASAHCGPQRSANATKRPRGMAKLGTLPLEHLAEHLFGNLPFRFILRGAWCSAGARQGGRGRHAGRERRRGGRGIGRKRRGRRDRRLRRSGFLQPFCKSVAEPFAIFRR